MAADRIVLQCSSASEAYHSSQHVDVAPAMFDDRGFVDVGSLLEHVLHLFGLHAIPANLEQPVDPTTEGEPAGVSRYEIAHRVVHTPVRAGGEYPGCRIRRFQYPDMSVSEATSSSRAAPCDGRRHSPPPVTCWRMGRPSDGD